jgi:hypothetical protein
MGFVPTGDSITVRARLTKKGRQKLLNSNSSIFSHFVLGDSDANYNTDQLLPKGKIPVNSGNLGAGGAENDNIYEGVNVKSKLYVTTSPITKKLISTNDLVPSQITVVGENTLSGDNLTFTYITKSANTEDTTNYFSTLSLPITDIDVATFNSNWGETGFSGLSNDRLLLGVISNDKYGELIDGKSIKCELPVVTGYTSGGTPTGITTYTIYSTFPNTTLTKAQLDSQYRDESINSTSLFNGKESVAYLFSDSKRRPNNDPLKSWATGYDTFKAYSVNGKERMNINTVGATGIYADPLIGVAYLDKGILAFTDPDIVDNLAVNFSGDPNTNIATNNLDMFYYSGSGFTTVVDSVQNDIVLNLICIADRNEFYNTENHTFNSLVDDVRISEIAITDSANNVLAIGKLDRHVTKKKYDLVVFDVQIVI